MASQSTGSLRRLFRALIYSLQGLRAAFLHEAAFRLEILLSFIFIPLGFWLGETGVEKALLIGSVLLIVIIELINSGIEAVVDRVSDERHVLSGRAKDVGSAAVLIALVNAFAIWLLVVFV